MTLSRGLIAGIVAVLLALTGLGGYGWLQGHDARTKAETASAVQQKTADAAKSDATATADQLKQTLAALQAQAAKPATPQSIVFDTSKLIPNMPQPIVIQAAPVPAAGNGPALPASPAGDAKPQQQLVIPAADFQAIQTAEIGCQENVASLAACTKEAVDTQTQLTAATAEAKEWKTAANGGSWIKRTVTALKFIGIGAGVGYVVAHKW
jgi:uncharacterized protein HemX